jgi:DNA modification methylase
VTATIHHGDCLEILRAMPDASVDAVVTDPPYGLSFMGKKWDYDVPSEDIWRECLRVLKSGGHLLAFAGTRTQHRMAVRIEDAGFEIRDMIAWVYGSGFPKSLDVSKAIDKAAGAQGSRGPMKRGGERLARLEDGKRDGEGRWGNETGRDPYTYSPTTEAARQWQGWGTALKPALEPITLARKPLEGTVAANVLTHGTGALNIDSSRIPTDPSVDDPRLGGGGTWLSDKMAKNVYEGGYAGERVGSSTLGRWPANVIHDGSEEVLAGFPDSKAGDPRDDRGYGGIWSPSKDGIPAGPQYGDSGSAARFFYCAKASKADRDEGCEGLPQTIKQSVADGDKRHGTLPYTNEPREMKPRPRGNHHPTVKPTALMRYLCRLVTPPGGVVLDPFTGSGSTGKAAILEGFQFIGIEREAEYVAIAKARIVKAEAQRREMLPFQEVAA